MLDTVDLEGIICLLGLELPTALGDSDDVVDVNVIEPLVMVTRSSALSMCRNRILPKDGTGCTLLAELVASTCGWDAGL